MWSVKTTSQTREEVNGLIGHVTGRGHTFSYESDLVSSKGLSPDGNEVATIIPGEDLQDPPKKVYLESSGELEAKFGAGALQMGPATTNLLPAGSRDAEDYTDGFTAVASATLADEATIRVQGSGSVKITSTGAGDGAITDTLASGLTGSTLYTGSVYVYCASAISARVTLRDDSTNTDTNFTTAAAGWKRVVVSHTTVGSPTFLKLEVTCQAAGAQTLYIDALQVEEQSEATPWVDGSRAAHSLMYEGLANLSDAVSFCCWTRDPSTNPSNNSTLFHIGDTSNDFLSVERNSGANEVRVYVSHDGSGTSYQADTSTWDDAWHHIGVTLNPIDLELKVFVDGTLELTQAIATANYPHLKNDGDRVYIGGEAGATTYWRGPISEVFVVPYVMQDMHVQALNARTIATPGLPKLDMGGTCNVFASPAESFPVSGTAQGSEYTNACTPTAYTSGYVDFTLLSDAEF
jgi:hypothetical protein